MYSLDSGRLNKRIQIWGYQDTEVTALGSSRTKLQKKAEVWAEIHPTRGYEFLEYYQDSNSLQYKVTIRYRPGITEKDVLVRGEHQFEINSIIDIDYQHVALEIYCTEMKDHIIPDTEV